MKTFRVVFKQRCEAEDITVTVKAENSHEALWKLCDADIGGIVKSLVVIDNGLNTDQTVREL